MADQQARPTGRRQCPGEQSELARVAVEASRTWTARQAPGALGAPLATPIKKPDRKAAGGQVADRLEILFDTFGKPADHYALRARFLGPQVTPAQPCPILRDKAAPSEPRRLHEPSRQSRALGGAGIGWQGRFGVISQQTHLPYRSPGS